MNKAVKPYHYFDTPDGEDVLKKLWFVLKPASATALTVGTCDVMLYSHPKGYLPTLGRYAYISIPILGMSTAFVVFSNMLHNMRDKDDIWNWAGAGAVAGSILGAWRKSPQVGTVSAGLFAFMGGFKKHCHQNGIILVPSLMTAKMHGGVINVRHDYSLLEDKVGEWKKKYKVE